MFLVAIESSVEMGTLRKKKDTEYLCVKNNLIGIDPCLLKYWSSYGVIVCVFVYVCVWYCIFVRVNSDLTIDKICITLNFVYRESSL